MNVNIKDLNKSTIEISITLSAEETKAFEDQAVNKIKNNVEIKGFRKGKAPNDKVIAKVGKEVIQQEVQELAINDSYPKALDSEKVEVASRPLLKDLKWDGDALTYVVEVGVKPTFELGDWKAKVEALPTVEVTEEEIQAEIEKELAQFTKHELVSRESKLNDLVVIDFEGFLGDEAFEGGKGESHPLELGSNSFIPGFEEQLVGHKAGADVEVNVTFPEEYHSEALAGKDAIFKVRIHEVKEKVLPELNDEFVADLDREEKSVEEFKNNVSAKLLKAKTDAAKNEVTTKVLDALVADANIEISDLQIDSEIERKLEEMNQQLAQQGLNLEQYLQLTGQDIQAMKENLAPEITNQVSRSLIIEAIVDAENFEVTDEEINTELETMATTYGMKVEDIKNALGGNTEMLKSELQYRKAVDSLTK